MLKKVIVLWVCRTRMHTETKCLFYCRASGYLLMVLNRLRHVALSFDKKQIIGQ